MTCALFLFVIHLYHLILLLHLVGISSFILLIRMEIQRAHSFCKCLWFGSESAWELGNGLLSRGPCRHDFYVLLGERLAVNNLIR